MFRPPVSRSFRGRELAIAIYVVSQVVRKRQGIDLGMVYGEIPVE